MNDDNLRGRDAFIAASTRYWVNIWTNNTNYKKKSAGQSVGLVFRSVAQATQRTGGDVGHWGGFAAAAAVAAAAFDACWK